MGHTRLFRVCFLTIVLCIASLGSTKISSKWLRER